MAELTPAMLPSASPALAARLEPIRTFAAQPAVKRALPAVGTVSALLLAGIAWYSFQSPAQAPVFSGLGDADKAAIAEALQSAGIAHAIDRDTGAVTVAEDAVHKARMLLAAQGLPKGAPSGDALMAALPMGASRAMEGETLRGAREADLARTIEGIEAVKSARVHLAMPEPSPFLRDEAAPAASVMLTLQTGRTLSEAQVRAIGHLVASSVPGLNAEQVSVVDQSGQLLSQRSGLDDRTLELQTQIEDRSRRALSALLGPLIGTDNYTAEIHAELDPSESQSTRETYPKDDRALRREEGTKSVSGSAAPAGGIPGALSNTPPPASTVTTTPPAAAGATPAAAGTDSQENYARAFDVGREISVTRQPTGKLKRLSVAVALREVKGAKPRTAAEIAAIENLVKNAVGFDAARGDSVAIASRPFAETVVEPVAFYDKPWFMSALRQGGALLAALLVFFFIGRPLLRALRARSGASTPDETALAAELLAAPRLGSAQPVTLDMIDAAPSYEARANLVRDFVRQDSARAATVVKQLMAERANG